MSFEITQELIDKAIKDAEEMGITVSDRIYGWHSIVKDGKETPLDVKEHLKFP